MAASEKLDKSHLLLHPVRMRLLIALAGQRLTAQQLLERLPDVSQATLYRHLGVLTQEQVIRVVEENPVRGTVEKVYALNDEAANLSAEDLASLSQEDHLRSFMVFLVSLLDEFQHYIKSEPSDFVGDGFGYHAVPLYLSGEEFKTLVMGMNEVMKPYLSNSPSPERRRRLFSSIIIPDAASTTGEKDGTQHE